MATSEWVNNVLVGYEGAFRTPFAPAAFCRGSWSFFDDFILQDATTTALAGYTVSQINATSDGTLVVTDGDGGLLAVTGGSHDGAGINCQSLTACAALPAANYHMWFEARMKVTDADDLDWFLGLAVNDANVFSTDPTELVAFRGDDGDANIDFQVRSGGTGAQADTGVDLSDNAWTRLGFHVNGTTSVTPYINDTAYTAVTANIPTAAMKLTFGVLNGATTTTNALILDWIRIIKTVAR